MIPSLGILNSVTSLEGSIAFHEKALWLKLRFPLYPCIMNFFIRMQLASPELKPNEYRYLLYLTLICKKLEI